MEDEHGFTFECACQNKSMSKKYVCDFLKRLMLGLAGIIDNEPIDF